MAEAEKKSPIVFIAIIGVLLLLMAGAISYFMASYIAGDKVQTTGKSRGEPGMLFQVGDPKDGIIVNINGGRFVKTIIVLELLPVKNADKESKHDEVRMTDAVVRVLRAQKAEDFDTDKQEAVREKIKAEVNSALGYDRVMHVYITSFVLQ